MSFSQDTRSFGVKTRKRKNSDIYRKSEFFVIAIDKSVRILYNIIRVQNTQVEKGSVNEKIFNKAFIGGACSDLDDHSVCRLLVKGQNPYGT